MRGRRRRAGGISMGPRQAAALLPSWRNMAKRISSLLDGVTCNNRAGPSKSPHGAIQIPCPECRPQTRVLSIVVFSRVPGRAVGGSLRLKWLSRCHG